MNSSIERAIVILGNGFLDRSDEMDASFLYKGLIQLVFRISFLRRSTVSKRSFSNLKTSLHDFEYDERGIWLWLKEILPRFGEDFWLGEKSCPDSCFRPLMIELDRLGQLDSLYEELLEKEAIIENGVFSLQHSQNRKHRGSFYTDKKWVDIVLKDVLEPFFQSEDPGKITLCDPACGSGHFLLAAALRVYECVPKSYNSLFDLICRCIYGVDIDPIAVELCRFNLWFVTDKNLDFLSVLRRNIRLGNALIGGWPALVEEGLPDMVVPAGELRKKNRILRKKGLVSYNQRSADAWCSSFFDPVDERSVGSFYAAESTQKNRSFFHWPLSFPDIFADGGFDVVVGNPPFLFLSGKGSIVKKLRDQKRELEANRWKREIGFCSFVYAETSSGCKDLYKWFTALVMRVMKKNGRYGLILPNGWISLPRYRDINFLLVQNGLSRTIDFGFDAFPNAVVPTCAVIGGGDPKIKIQYKDQRSPSKNQTYPIHKGLFQRFQNVLASRFWSANQNTIDDWIQIREGVHSTITGGGRHLFFEDAAMQRFLSPPTRNVGISNEKSLRSDKWHVGDRILLRKTGDLLVCAVVHSKQTIWAHQNVYVIHPRLGIDVYLIQALLGSKMMSFLYRGGTLGQKDRPMAQLRISGIRSLPVPEPSAFSHRKDVLIALSKRLSRSPSMAIWMRINEIVYELYGVSELEKKEIESWCLDVDL
ncbi:MAG: N-6 DNA methylase [Myxococcota bacterium]|nr:N-6 DNA methylase [Myxococcota bacterium]